MSHPAAEPAATPRDRSPWGRALAIAAAAASIVTLVLLAFLWPTVASEPRGLGLDVVGGDRAQTLVDTSLAQVQERTGSRPFDTRPAASREEAVSRIEKMDSYGAVVVDDAGGVEVLTATAASPAVATMLQQVATGIGQQSAVAAGQARAALGQEAAKAGARAAAAQAAAQTLAGVRTQRGGDAAASPQAKALAQKARQADAQARKAADAAQQAQARAQAASAPTMTLTDVVPLNEDDPRGAGLSLAGLPMTLGGIVGGVLMALQLRGTWRRLLGLLAYAALGGGVMVAVLDGWFGILHGSPLVLWLAIAASLTATAALIVGLHSLLGQPGIPLGAVTTMLIGNPISSVGSPSSFLPGSWGEIGQHFVPGATGTLMKALSYFPDADVTRSWVVLAAWAAAGLLFTLIGHHRTGGTGHRQPA